MLYIFLDKSISFFFYFLYNFKKLKIYFFFYFFYKNKKMSSFPLYRLHIVTATPHMVRLLGILLISTFCGSLSARLFCEPFQ